MKKNQTDSPNDKRMYNAKLPSDPDGRIDRLLLRIQLAMDRLERAVIENKKEVAYKNKRLIADMEKEIHEWKQLKK